MVNQTIKQQTGQTDRQTDKQPAYQILLPNIWVNSGVRQWGRCQWKGEGGEDGETGVGEVLHMKNNKG